MDQSEPSPVDQKILEAAQSHFARKGFHDTRVSEIADEAGVGKGTVYRHFGKKSALFAGLIEQVTEELIEQINKIPEQVSAPDQQVRAIFDVHMNVFQRARPLMEIFVNEGLRKTGDHRQAIVERWRRYREIVSESFALGVENGGFQDRDPEVLTRIFLSWIWGLFRSAVIFDETKRTVADGDTLIEVFLEGITVETN